MVALYHKHRPQNFSEMIGQEHIVQTLTNQIKSERVAHAYLFSGSRGIGKTTAARLLAKAVNCPEKKPNSVEPCNNCEICNEISRSSSIDVIEIDAASHTGVDNVRENIIENALFRPTKSKYKIFIIDEAHMLSTAAFNALLKILEEPPEYVMFILATTENHKLLPTIVSRCQRFNFKKVPFDTMKKHIENIAKKEDLKIDKDVVERIINKSDGCVRDAVSLLDQIMAANEKHITAEIASVVLPTSNMDEIIEFIKTVLNKETSKALIKINQLAEEGVDMKQFAYDVVEILRIMLISKSQTKLTNTAIDLSKDTEKELLKLNKLVSPVEIIKLIDLFMARQAEIKMHAIPQLPIELAVVEWSTNKSESPKNDDEDKDNSKNEEPKKEEEKNDKEEKKSLTERVKEIVGMESSITIEEIKAKWDNFIDEIEKQSASLSFILKTATPAKMNGGALIISVNFNIHKDKLMSADCRKKIEEILSNIYNTKIRIDATVDESEMENKKIDNELQDLTAAFGGEVVN